MPKFLIILDRKSRAPFPDTETFSRVILENNTKWETVPDFSGASAFHVAVVCENKPRDMPIFGVSWQEVSDRPTREHAATLTEEDLLDVEQDSEYLNLINKNA